jgi:hypothetical protein
MNTETKTPHPVGSSAWLECLAAKWEREGDELIQRASEAPTWEQDAAWRNSGCAAHRCAKELRAEMEKHSNDKLSHG